MGNKPSAPEPFSLTEFKKAKLMFEFHTFYDVNKDGKLQWKDFELAREHICEKSGWKKGSPKWIMIVNLFKDMWQHLQEIADENGDGTITVEEWVKMWTSMEEKEIEEKAAQGKDKKKQEKEKEKENNEEGNEEEKEEVKKETPDWLESYIQYKFDLLDRAADGHIDQEEFEYVLSWFDIPALECRTAFNIVSLSGGKKITFPYFRQMSLEYFRSNDPTAMGTYINGRLEYGTSTPEPS